MINNIGGKRQAYKLAYGFHDVNSILYMVYPMLEVFRSGNLALFTLTSILLILKRRLRSSMISLLSNTR